MNNILLKKNSAYTFLINFVVVIFIIIVATYEFDFNYYYRNILLAGISFTFLFFILFYNKKFIHLKQDLPFLLFILYLCFNTAKVAVYRQSSFSATVTFFCYYILIKILVVDIQWFGFYKKGILLFSLVQTFGIYFEKIFPSLYVSIISCFSLIYEDAMNSFNMGACSGFTGQTGIVVLYPLIIIGFSFYSLSSKNPAPKDIFRILFAAGGILFSGKRSGVLFSLVAILIVLYFYLRKMTKWPLMVLLKKILPILLVLGLIIIILSPFLSFILDRFSNKSKNINDLSSGRLYIWLLTLSYFFKKPVFGYGFNYIIMSGDLPDQMATHNVYIELLAEIGIIGLFFYSILIIYNLVITVRIFNYVISLNIKNLKKFVFFSLYYQIFYILYSFVGNPIYDMNYFSTYVISVAMSYGMINILNDKGL
jgi:O-antigen ligase